MLDYDNSAFYYFAITLITIYLIPGTWYFLKALYEGACPSPWAALTTRHQYLTYET
jgi:hypothetical protein